MPIVCGGVVYALVTDAYDAFEHFGFLNFLTSSQWSYTAGNEQYGALPFITGTLLTTFLALVMCVPFSLPVALFTGEYFSGRKIASILGTVTEKDGKPYLHLHATFCDANMQAHGGHVNALHISATCEMVLRLLPGQVGRQLDEVTGLNLFDFKGME